MEIVEIRNRWHWGESINLISEGCGLLKLEFVDGTHWGFISGLVVHPSRQKQGIATGLMMKAEDIVKNEGFDLIAISVEKDREWQFNWYKRLGYEVYDEDDDEYWLRKYIK